jgi:hypothetical protein
VCVCCFYIRIRITRSLSGDGIVFSIANSYASVSRVFIESNHLFVEPESIVLYDAMNYTSDQRMQQSLTPDTSLVCLHLP